MSGISAKPDPDRPVLADWVLADSSEAVLARFGQPSTLLTPAERARAALFRSPTHADDYVAAHLLVRVAAALVLGTAPQRLTLVQRCVTCGGSHGRPSVAEEPDLAVSLAHARGHVAAAAGSGPIGVDVEVNPTVGFDIVDAALSPGEAELVRGAPEPAVAFLDLWVRKEALVKAGRATLDSLAAIDLAADPERWEDLYLTGWRGPNGVVGACAAPRRVEPRTVAAVPVGWWTP